MGLPWTPHRAKSVTGNRRKSICIPELTEQKSHTALSVSTVRNQARATAKEAIDIQKHEFKSLAVMADWDSTEGVYITMSECRQKTPSDRQGPTLRPGSCACFKKWWNKVCPPPPENVS